MIGTRFYASEEALGHERAKQRIAAAHGGETGRTTVFDIVRELAWPASYSGRGLRNRFVERWHGRERELSAVLDDERGTYQAATRAGDLDTAVVWAGEAIDLIVSVERAATLVQRISTQAELQLALGASLAKGHSGASARERKAGSPHPTVYGLN